MVLSIVGSAPAILNILCLVSHILKGYDTQRQQAGILREGTGGTGGQEEGGTHVFYSDFSGHGMETSK